MTVFAGVWWNWVLSISWQAAILFLAVMAVSIFARKTSARFRHLLWLLVLVKLFTPPSLGSNWSFGHWFVRPVWERVGEPVEDIAASTFLRVTLFFLSHSALHSEI